jgi:hypothetical protein
MCNEYFKEKTIVFLDVCGKTTMKNNSFINHDELVVLMNYIKKAI